MSKMILAKLGMIGAKEGSKYFFKNIKESSKEELVNIKLKLTTHLDL